MRSSKQPLLASNLPGQYTSQTRQTAVGVGRRAAAWVGAPTLRLALACGAVILQPASTLAQVADQEDERPEAGADPQRSAVCLQHPFRRENVEVRAIEPADCRAERTGDTSSVERAGAPSLGPIRLSMFIDAYAAWQTSGEGTLAALSGHLASTGQGPTLRAENGFSLAFYGLDVQYDAGSFGAVANMRFGPAATLFHGENDALFGIDHLTQAYALYRPVAQLELDLGMFMSPFGYEALESWKNPNYTISALYTYGQPNWHTGLRATWQLDSLCMMAMVVNGANNISETQQKDGLDQRPMLGGSIALQVGSALSLTVGGLLALNHKDNDDEGLDAFLDMVATLELGALTTALNVDYMFTQEGAPGGGNRHFIGESLTASYRLSPVFGVAARGEYLRDDASFDGGVVWHLLTGTVTLDVQPVPRLRGLFVRWENRWERSNQRIFGNDSRGTEDPSDDSHRRTWFESVLGVVVTTDP